jgi:hypothetical protein
MKNVRGQAQDATDRHRLREGDLVEGEESHGLPSEERGARIAELVGEPHMIATEDFAMYAEMCQDEFVDAKDGTHLRCCGNMI